MNPWAILLAIFAICGIIVAKNGKQDDLIAAFLGRQYGNSTLR